MKLSSFWIKHLRRIACTWRTPTGPIGCTLATPTRYTTHLYFPTFQYRDGTVHNTVMFDVTLYAQNAEKSAWDGTAVEAGDFMSMDDGAEVISVERTVQRRVLYGEKANEDIWLATSS